VDLKVIEAIACHASIRTTAVYVEANSRRLAQIQDVTWRPYPDALLFDYIQEHEETIDNMDRVRAGAKVRSRSCEGSATDGGACTATPVGARGGPDLRGRSSRLSITVAFVF
jgi:hypothetical protein